MKQNFTTRVSYDGHTVHAVIIPQHRKDGMYFEVNVPGIDRFYMHWSSMDRYDIVPEKGLSVPYNLVLAVSDAIEERTIK
ncbi:MAG: hypothetical protein KDC07_03575 [Chitinophagaceae bacterium]|nr:hypothetical protein [Chitinophagaceae bacterium]MCB9044567.1 hypothetical protein [Chitinophagales bacterium]